MKYINVSLKQYNAVQLKPHLHIKDINKYFLTRDCL